MKKIIITLLVLFIGYLGLALLPYINPQDISESSKQEIIENLNGSQFQDESITLIKDPQEALELRIAMIQNAKERIDMSYYIIQEGETSQQILAELLTAAKRGVKVRVLVDGKIGGLSGHLGKALSVQENMNIYLYNPLNLFKPGDLFSVHHEKYLNIDDKYALIGGRNIGDRYFTRPKEGIETAADLDVFVHQEKERSELSVILSEYMDQFLEQAPIKKVKAKGHKILSKLYAIENDKYFLDSYISRSHPINNMVLLTNPATPQDTPPVIPFVFKELVKRSDEVMLQTPYITAHKETLELLRMPKKITLLTNSVSSSTNFPAFSNYYFNKKKFTDTEIDIFEYQSTGKASLHTKAYIFDDYVSVGSFNLDDRSFFINTEMMLLVDSEAFKDELIKSMTEDLKASYQVSGEKKEIGLDMPIPVSSFKKALMWFSGIFSTLFRFLI